jgi:hypothetical protein
MSDTPETDAQENIRQAIISTEDLNAFGVPSQPDPRFGNLKFYMWDSMFPVDSSGMPVPNYAVQEAAKLFFGRSPDWLRWRYRKATNRPHGYFVLNGVVLEPKRTEAGSRYYTLADIERMAYALVENYAIDPEQLYLIIQTVLIQARLNYIIGEENQD